ncbi:uncharacterized protein CDV56_106782 [Aspergillus thermomutatus]|uniref:Uncharacterized protein n=1 Tax=Aspergillus thermomutatus TaxID=41047 RepID=A0A397GXP7_ASPTH|nr:uncharacterized protein CDV56_106782 [Aspergillus thermomutatus]RHZ55761.1 hypothetical protein CDV56_106782 [Aspergillus thermomutatus]
MFFLILSLFPSAALSLTNDSHTNTTTADQELVGWISPSNHRSTSEIIWSCLAIFLVCTWKCMHLNIPSEKERGTTEWVKVLGVPLPKPSPELRRKWLKRVGWMFVLAIAPELGVMISVDQRHEAEELYDRHKHMDWSLVHAYYANMGGFSIAIPEEEEEIKEGETSVATNAAAETENTMAPQEINAESHVQDAAADKGDPSVEERLIGLDNREKKTRLRIRRLQGGDLARLDELGLFPATDASDTKNRALPITTIDDIQDRSKSDAFTKFFALLQCTWLVIQSIARACAGLPITELELTTLAFIFCAFVMYWFWWDKPFDIQTPTILLCPPEKAKQMREVIKRRERFLGSDGEPRFHQINALATEAFLDMFSRSPKILRLSPASVAVSFYLTAFVFAGLHLIAWNWEFPTPMTRTMWRAFSLLMLTSSLLPMLAFWLKKKLGDEDDEDHSECCAIACAICCCTEKGTCGFWISGVILFLSYVVARLGILFLVFYCFRAMPADVYSSLSWTAIFPHLG